MEGGRCEGQKIANPQDIPPSRVSQGLLQVLQSQTAPRGRHETKIKAGAPRHWLVTLQESWLMRTVFPLDFMWNLSIFEICHFKLCFYILWNQIKHTWIWSPVAGFWSTHCKGTSEKAWRKGRASSHSLLHHLLHFPPYPTCLWTHGTLGQGREHLRFCRSLEHFCAMHHKVYTASSHKHPSPTPMQTQLRVSKSLPSGLSQHCTDASQAEKNGVLFTGSRRSK